MINNNDEHSIVIEITAILLGSNFMSLPVSLYTLREIYRTVHDEITTPLLVSLIFMGLFGLQYLPLTVPNEPKPWLPLVTTGYPVPLAL